MNQSTLFHSKLSAVNYQNLLSAFRENRVDSVKTALVEHSLQLGFEAVPFKLLDKALHSTRRLTSILKSLPGIMNHIPVFRTVLSIHSTKKPPFCSTVADSATAFLHVAPMRHFSQHITFHLLWTARTGRRTNC